MEISGQVAELLKQRYSDATLTLLTAIMAKMNEDQVWAVTTLMEAAAEVALNIRKDEQP